MPQARAAGESYKKVSARYITLLAPGGHNVHPALVAKNEIVQEVLKWRDAFVPIVKRNSSPITADGLSAKHVIGST